MVTSFSGDSRMSKTQIEIRMFGIHLKGVGLPGVACVTLTVVLALAVYAFRPMW
jgi:hypothetical protein